MQRSTILCSHYLTVPSPSKQLLAAALMQKVQYLEIYPETVKCLTNLNLALLAQTVGQNVGSGGGGGGGAVCTEEGTSCE